MENIKKKILVVVFVVLIVLLITENAYIAMANKGVIMNVISTDTGFEEVTLLKTKSLGSENDLSKLKLNKDVAVRCSVTNESDHGRAFLAVKAKFYNKYGKQYYGTFSYTIMRSELVN